MSINPETLGRTVADPVREPMADELDRTDELPRLDVAAYEASLANTQQGLARTDIWSVTALHEIGELTEAESAAEASGEGSKSSEGALTVNVDAILKRIADLEADVITAHEANDALQKRNEATAADRDRLVARVQTLEAENARQREHRELAQEMAERLERKLRDELQQAKKTIEQLLDTQTNERATAHSERTELQARLSSAAREHGVLDEANRKLQGEVGSLRTLAQERAHAITHLEHLLSEEKTLAAKVARQLAAKLTDYDKVSAMLATRNDMVDDLICIRDALEEQLRNERAAHARTSDGLIDTKRTLDEQLALATDRERIISEKNAQLAEASLTIAKLRESVELAEEAIAQRDLERSEAASARVLQEEHVRELSRELDQARQTGVTLGSELEQSRAQIQRLNHERDALATMQAELAARLKAAEHANSEVARVRDQILADHARAQETIRELTSEREALLPLKDELQLNAVNLEQYRLEAAQLAEQLRVANAAAEENARIAREQAMELETVRTKLREQVKIVRGLEQTIATRDELSEQLHAQIQTADDQRAALSNQLEKARRRVKALSEEVFRRDHRIGELRTELTVHTEALAAIRRDINRVGRDEVEEETDGIERVLEPVDHTGETIVLSGKMLTVGRTTESDVCIPSKLVSRHHARLLVGPTGVIIEDAGSTNGCYVNGKQVRKHLMHDGDVLELGDLRYRLATRDARDTKVRANVIPMFEQRPNP